MGDGVRVGGEPRESCWEVTRPCKRGASKGFDGSGYVRGGVLLDR